MEMMSLLSIYSIRIAVFSIFELAARYTSGAALLRSKCVMVKWGAEMISPALLTNIPKRSKECHERFHLDMGGGLSQVMKVLQRVRHLSRIHQRKVEA